jgi:hypothetical protein
MLVWLVSRPNPADAVCWSSCSRFWLVPGTASPIEPDVSSTTSTFDLRWSAVTG